MSELKEFVRYSDQCVLVSDSRDIVAPYDQRQAVWDWCELNKITAEYQGTWYCTDLWRVRDDKQRVRFALRWS